jgi:hypothetical protein
MTQSESGGRKRMLRSDDDTILPLKPVEVRTQSDGGVGRVQAMEKRDRETERKELEAKIKKKELAFQNVRRDRMLEDERRERQAEKKEERVLRKALRNEAKKIAFARDSSQLLGAGNRRISLFTGKIVRKNSLYNLKDLEQLTPPVQAVHHDDDDSSDDDGPAALKDGHTFSFLGFEDQTQADLLLLQDLQEVKPKLLVNRASKVPKNTRTIRLDNVSLMQQHVADHSGVEAANARFVEKIPVNDTCAFSLSKKDRAAFKSRFQPVKSSPLGTATQLFTRLPNPLRSLMSPITHRNRPSRNSMPIPPLRLEPVSERGRSYTS